MKYRNSAEYGPNHACVKNAIYIAHERSLLSIKLKKLRIRKRYRPFSNLDARIDQYVLRLAC